MEIFGECNTEKVLIEILGFKPHHVSGRSRVINKLKRRKNTVGIVDSDPGRPSPHYMDHFIENNDLSSKKHGFKVLHDPKNNNWLIVLQPRFEEWIINIAKAEKVTLKEYSLPEDPDKLHAILTAKRNERILKRLLNDLKDSSALRSLKEVLRKIHYSR